MPEKSQQEIDVPETTRSTRSRSTSSLGIHINSSAAPRQRSTSAKYYNIATSILSNDIDELFLGAARDGEYEKIEHILQRRSDVIVSIDVIDKRTGNTPLMWAAKKGYSKIVQLLIKHGADPTLHNYEKLSALEMATSNIKTILLDSVEKTTESSHRLLLQAAWQGNIKIVRRLLSQNKVLDINCQNAEGLSPLLLVTRDIQLFERLAVQLNRLYNPIEVAIELLNHRAAIHMTDGDGKTCLHYACSSRATVATELVKTLIESGSELELRDKRFFTPIHLASNSGNHGVVTTLIEGGSEVNSRGFMGLTPLHITSQKDHQRAAVVLLENGADVTLVDDQGNSAVDLAKSKKMRTTLKEAWSEATQKKSSPNLAPVKAPSREEKKGPIQKKKGEVIFDGLVVVTTPAQTSRPGISRSGTTLSNADKARKAEEQMMLDIDHGTFTHMPNVKEGMKRLNALRGGVKSKSLPKVSKSCVSSSESLSPELSEGRRTRQGGENVRRSLEDGRNITTPRKSVPYTPASRSRTGTTSSIEELDLCIQNNRQSPAPTVERSKSHHRSDSDPFSSPSLSDLTVSYDNIISLRRGRSESDSTTPFNEETDDDVFNGAQSRVPRTPLDREITALNIPTTIPESLSPRTCQKATVSYLDTSRRLPTGRQQMSTPICISQRSYSFLDAKLVDVEAGGNGSKDSSPRSDEEDVPLSRAGSLRLIMANPAELLRNRSLLKEEFVLEESRTRDPMMQSSGSDPLSSGSSLASSPRDTGVKSGLSVSSKLPGIDGRTNGISSSGKPVKRSQSFTQGLRASNQNKEIFSVQRLSMRRVKGQMPKRDIVKNSVVNSNIVAECEKSDTNVAHKLESQTLNVMNEQNNDLKKIDENENKTNDICDMNKNSNKKCEMSNKNSSAMNLKGEQTNVSKKQLTKPQVKTVDSDAEKSSKTNKNCVSDAKRTEKFQSGAKDLAVKNRTNENNNSDKSLTDNLKSKPQSKDFKVSFKPQILSPESCTTPSVSSAKTRSMSAVSSKSVNSTISAVSCKTTVSSVVGGVGEAIVRNRNMSAVSCKSVNSSNSGHSVKNGGRNKTAVDAEKNKVPETQNDKNHEIENVVESSKSNSNCFKPVSIVAKSVKDSQHQTPKNQNTNLNPSSKTDYLKPTTAQQSSKQGVSCAIKNKTPAKKVSSLLKVMGIKTDSAIKESSDFQPTSKTQLNQGKSRNPQMISQSLTSIQTPKTPQKDAIITAASAATTAASGSSSAASRKSSAASGSSSATSGNSSKAGCSQKYRINSAGSQSSVPTPKRSASPTKMNSVQKSHLMPKSSASTNNKNSARSCAISGIQVTLSDASTPTPDKSVNMKTELRKSSSSSSINPHEESSSLKPYKSESHIPKSSLKKKHLEPKEPLVRISVPGEEPKVNLSQQNLNDFLAEMHTPVIVNPFENFVAHNNENAENLNRVSDKKPDYSIAKSKKDAVVKNKTQTKARTIKSARKPRAPSSASSRQTSAGKKKGGKCKTSNNTDQVRPKSGRVPKRGKSAKRCKKGTNLAEHAAKHDVALISGIGWQLATGCIDNSDVKVATFIGSDSDVSDIYDDPDINTERDLLPSPCPSPLTPSILPRYCEVKYEDESPEVKLPPIISDSNHDDFNSDEYNEITASLHREILRNKMTPIPESPGNSLSSLVTKPKGNFYGAITEDINPGNQANRDVRSKNCINFVEQVEGHLEGNQYESQSKFKEYTTNDRHSRSGSVSPESDENGENINEVIDEILNMTSSSLNSTLKSNKSMRSTNSTLTDVDARILRELRKPVAGFHAKLDESDDDDGSDESIIEVTPPKIKVNSQVHDEGSKFNDEEVNVRAEAKELAKVVRTFGNLELHAGGSFRSTGKRSGRRDYPSLQPDTSLRKPPSGRPLSPGIRGQGRFQELKPVSPRMKELRMDQRRPSEKKSPEDAVLEQLQEVVDAELLVQSLVHVIKEDGNNSNQISHLSQRRGSGASSACTSDSLTSTIEETIQWKKGNVLGKGAFGTVFCGLTNEGELIAVKQIELNSMDHEKAQREYEKVQEEVELLKNLKHQNIVGYLGTSFEDSIVSIFMQFVPGGSLANVLGRFGALEESVFRRYTKQILEGVEYLHNNEVIHRDIKGGNVMLMPNGIIKLIDFGCAKRLCFNLSMSQSQILKSMKGTPYWMAPEVVSETGHGKKSDIWSIGCTVFEMATRKPPWSNMNPMAAIFAIGSNRPVPELAETFSVLARKFVSDCLTRDQNDRPSATELLSHPFIIKKPPSRK
ncbi:hypothetical protein SNE40_002244 [Patella caerulea]|uniref:Mitogen-activated protein kinase kinase kinase 19 n=1 Tax=Patella caerulea TaxID=87958 RepID=A0AAN8QE24_PATCE